MYRHIKEVARGFGVTDWSWVGIDASGPGFGTASTFKFHNEPIHRMFWGERCPHIQLLAGHDYYADEFYDGMPAYLYFSFLWLMHGNYVKISPHICDRTELERQFCNRQQKSSSRVSKAGVPLLKLEQKADFKSRMSNSPDHADSLVMAVYAAISKGPEKAQLVSGRIPPPLRVNIPDYDSFNHVKPINWGQEKDED
jgi:hypothetical protein